MATGRVRASGYTLLGLLFAVAGLGAALAALGALWQTAAQREKEQELLFIGGQFRAALASYRRMNPDGPPQGPSNLEALLLDGRFPSTVRHLRRVWPDPVSGRAEWGLVRDPAGGIIGVHSLAEGRPLKRSGFAPGLEAFVAAASYREWVFLASQDEARDAGGSPAAPATGAAEAATERTAATGPAPPAADAGDGRSRAGSPPTRLPECQAWLRREHLACRRAGGDYAALQTCTQAVLAAYRDCLGGD